MKPEVLGTSCFELCGHAERVAFENGSKMRQIGSSAFSGCAFLTSIAIPASVEMMERPAFKKCHGLEVLLVAQASNLV
jgi:hypothetical protein